MPAFIEVSTMDSDASSASSTTSFSQPASPTASLHPQQQEQHPPTLDRLIHHFAAAKASLSSASYASRAASLVSESRRLVEEVAILNARTVYLRRGVAEEVEVLKDIKAGIEREGDASSNDFRGVVDGLDTANERLQRTLDALRRTLIHESLRKKKSAKEQEEQLLDLGDEPTTDTEAPPTDEEDAPEKGTLYSFIDPTPHLTLLAALRTDIDAYHASHDDFEHTLTLFNTTLRTIALTLARADETAEPPEKRTLYDRDADSSSVRALFTGIEDHAGAMAELLQGLVAHYDLCVSALKHTEGGGEAAREMAQADIAGEKVEESLYSRKIPLPIDDDERTEMFAVLAHDAAELDDVISELRERGEEQEALFSQLHALASRARKTDGVLREVLTMLREMRALHLPSYTHAVTTFGGAWARIRAGMEGRTTTLLDLAASNEAFLSAYAELLREVERRERARAEMRAVADKARRDLEKLSKRDRAARQEFVEGFGGNLPQGIWDEAEDGEEGKEGGRGGVGWIVREVG